MLTLEGHPAVGLGEDVGPRRPPGTSPDGEVRGDPADRPQVVGRGALGGCDDERVARVGGQTRVHERLPQRALVDETRPRGEPVGAGERRDPREQCAHVLRRRVRREDGPRHLVVRERDHRARRQTGARDHRLELQAGEGPGLRARGVPLERVEHPVAVVLRRTGEVLDAELVLDREDQRAAGDEPGGDPVEEGRVRVERGRTVPDVLEHADHDDHVVRLDERDVIELADEHLDAGQVTPPLPRDARPCGHRLERIDDGAPLPEVARHRTAACTDLEHPRGLRQLERAQHVRARGVQVVALGPRLCAGRELVRLEAHVVGGDDVLEECPFCTVLVL